jgi:hypothetical protein
MLQNEMVSSINGLKHGPSLTSWPYFLSILFKKRIFKP